MKYLSNLIQRILRLGVIYVALMMLWVAAVYMAVIVNEEIANIEKDTTSLTNIGFLIFVALANVTFSWARNERRNSRIYLLNHLAKLCIWAALIFIIASIFKYGQINTNNFKPDALFNDAVVFSVKLLFFALSLLLFIILSTFLGILCHFEAFFIAFHQLFKGNWRRYVEITNRKGESIDSDFPQV